MAEEIELRKRKDENTWNQNLFNKNKLRRKGIKHLGEIRIRFIVCFSFIKLN